MLPYLRSEIHRLRHRRMVLVLVLLIALLPILVDAFLYVTVQAQLDAIRSGRVQASPGQAPPSEDTVRAVLRGLRPDRAPEFALGITAFVGAIFTTILAGNVMGSEFGWSTVRTVLAHGGRRAAFIFGKLAALGLTAVVLVLVGFVATFVGSYGLGIVAGLDLSVSADVLPRTVGYAARGVYAALPYLTFAVLVAVLARSAAAGIAFGLVLLFGESLVAQLAIQLAPDLRPLFDAGIARNVTTITRTPSAGPGPATLMPTAAELGFATGILALYVVAFTSLAIHRFAKRDLTLA